MIDIRNSGSHVMPKAGHQIKKIIAGDNLRLIKARAPHRVTREILPSWSQNGYRDDTGYPTLKLLPFPSNSKHSVSNLWTPLRHSYGNFCWASCTEHPASFARSLPIPESLTNSKLNCMKMYHRVLSRLRSINRGQAQDSTSLYNDLQYIAILIFFGSPEYAITIWMPGNQHNRRPTSAGGRMITRLGPGKEVIKVSEHWITQHLMTVRWATLR